MTVREVEAILEACHARLKGMGECKTDPLVEACRLTGMGTVGLLLGIMGTEEMMRWNETVMDFAADSRARLEEEAGRSETDPFSVPDDPREIDR